MEQPEVRFPEVQRFDNVVRVCFLLKRRVAPEHAKELANQIYHGRDVDWAKADVFYERTNSGRLYLIDIPRKGGEEDEF